MFRSIIVLFLLTLSIAACNNSSGGGGGGSSDPMLNGVSISSDTQTLTVDSTLQLTATDTFSDSTTEDITATASWVSSDDSIASVSNGVITSYSEGTVEISATLNNQTDSITITVVNPGTLDSIVFSESSMSIPNGINAELKAYGIYSDGSQLDITDSVTWASDDTTIASVSNDTASQGHITTNSIGQCHISASFDEISANIILNVTDAHLVQLSLSSSNTMIPEGVSNAITVRGIFSDNSTRVGSESIWKSLRG